MVFRENSGCLLWPRSLYLFIRHHYFLRAIKFKFDKGYFMYEHLNTLDIHLVQFLILTLKLKLFRCYKINGNKCLLFKIDIKDSKALIFEFVACGGGVKNNESQVERKVNNILRKRTHIIDKFLVCHNFLAYNFYNRSYLTQKTNNMFQII